MQDWSDIMSHLTSITSSYSVVGTEDICGTSSSSTRGSGSFIANYHPVLSVYVWERDIGRSMDVLCPFIQVKRCFGFGTKLIEISLTTKLNKKTLTCKREEPENCLSHYKKWYQYGSSSWWKKSTPSFSIKPQCQHGWWTVTVTNLLPLSWSLSGSLERFHN